MDRREELERIIGKWSGDCDLNIIDPFIENLATRILKFIIENYEKKSFK